MKPCHTRRSEERTAREAALLTWMAGHPGPVEHSAICLHYGWSASVVRKYLRTLQLAGACAATLRSVGRRRIRAWRVVDPAALADWHARQPSARRTATPAAPPPGLHLCGDDGWPLRRAQAPAIMRDPLVAALFGPAKTAATDLVERALDGVKLLPADADCRPSCGYLGAECNYPGCKAPSAKPAAPSAPPGPWDGGRIDWSAP